MQWQMLVLLLHTSLIVTPFHRNKKMHLESYLISFNSIKPSLICYAVISEPSCICVNHLSISMGEDYLSRTWKMILICGFLYFLPTLSPLLGFQMFTLDPRDLAISRALSTAPPSLNPYNIKNAKSSFPSWLLLQNKILSFITTILLKSFFSFIEASRIARFNFVSRSPSDRLCYLFHLRSQKLLWDEMYFQTINYATRATCFTSVNCLEDKEYPSLHTLYPKIQFSSMSPKKSWMSTGETARQTHAKLHSKTNIIIFSIIQDMGIIILSIFF